MKKRYIGLLVMLILLPLLFIHHVFPSIMADTSFTPWVENEKNQVVVTGTTPSSSSFIKVRDVVVKYSKDKSTATVYFISMPVLFGHESQEIQKDKHLKRIIWKDENGKSKVIWDKEKKNHQQNAIILSLNKQ